MVDTTNQYELKEKYNEFNDNTCEICYSYNKDDILSCKTCNQKICFECFNKNPVKNIGTDDEIKDEDFENGESYTYLIMNCFFCRTINNYNIGDFTKKQNNILTNNCIKELATFIKQLRSTSNYDTEIIAKIQDFKTNFEVAEENTKLKGQLNYYENMNENFMEMKMNYQWDFNVSAEQIAVKMWVKKQGETLLTVVLDTKITPLMENGSNKLILRKPFQSWKMSSGIYWQAFKLWCKRIPFYDHTKSKGNN